MHLFVRSVFAYILDKKNLRHLLMIYLRNNIRNKWKLTVDICVLSCLISQSHHHKQHAPIESILLRNCVLQWANWPMQILCQSIMLSVRLMTIKSRFCLIISIAIESSSNCTKRTISLKSFQSTYHYRFGKSITIIELPLCIGIEKADHSNWTRKGRIYYLIDR